jgi:predicted permease
VVGFFDRVQRELGTIPGVEAVELTSGLPLGRAFRSTGVHAQGGDPKEIVAGFQAVTSGYLATLGIPLRAGRPFLDTDRPEAPQVAIVDEVLASALWPGESPIGRRLSRSGPDGPWMEVVGVAGSVRQRSLQLAPPPILYSPYRQRGWDTMHVVLSTDGPMANVVDAARSRLAAFAPDQPIDAVTTLDQLVAASTAQTRLQTLLLASFGSVALILAALGIYAMVSFTVACRVPEIGVRMALGATRAAVMRLILRQGWWPLVAGTAAGVIAAWMSRQAIAHLLFGVAPADPLAFGAVPILLLAVGLAATYAPARRASRLSPTRAFHAR